MLDTRLPDLDLIENGGHPKPAPCAICLCISADLEQPLLCICSRLKHAINNRLPYI